MRHRLGHSKTFWPRAPARRRLPADEIPNGRRLPADEIPSRRRLPADEIPNGRRLPADEIIVVRDVDGYIKGCEFRRPGLCPEAPRDHPAFIGMPILPGRCARHRMTDEQEAGRGYPDATQRMNAATP
jgi:hypothetical protein